MTNSNTHGFTLVELMIVIAILGILVAVATHGIGNLTRRAREGTTKGNLAIMRAAIAAYQGDREGVYPTDNLNSLVPLFINKIPVTDPVTWHPPRNTVWVGDDNALAASEAGGWFYYNLPIDKKWGTLKVNCFHSDIKGVSWLTY